MSRGINKTNIVSFRVCVFMQSASNEKWNQQQQKQCFMSRETRTCIVQCTSLLQDEGQKREKTDYRRFLLLWEKPAAGHSWW